MSRPPRQDEPRPGGGSRYAHEVDEDGEEHYDYSGDLPYRGPSRRAFVVGFGPDPRSAATLEVVAQAAFKGFRLIVPSVIGQFFLITGLSVDEQTQLVGSGPIPALAFAETAVGVSLSLDTCPAGKTIALSYKFWKIGFKSRVKMFFRDLLARRFRAAFKWLRPSYAPPFMAALVGEIES